MPSNIGFKRVNHIQSLKLSDISTNTSKITGDSPTSVSKYCNFNACRENLSTEFLVETTQDKKSIVTQIDVKNHKIEKNNKKKKYNTRKIKVRTVKFIYVYKTRFDLPQDSSFLFKELIKLIN